MRQVTHALLTRPPLTYQSLGFMISPFDLHVLSTPPAFILSQDQTLMLKVRPASTNLALLFWFKDSHLLNVLENKIIQRIFKVALLFICQSSFPCCSLFSAATLIEYHIFKSLSTSFLNYFLSLLRSSCLPQQRK